MSVKLNLNNKIINGAFDYWQRGTSFAAIATNTYTTDRFVYYKSGVVVHSALRSTDVPSSSNSTYSIQLDCTTPDTSIASGDYSFIGQKIEGNLLKSFKNKKMVLSFWVKSAKTGIHCIAFQNNAQTRSIVKEYSVNVANTWEQKIVRIQHDSTGSWLYDTSGGMLVYWVLSCGSTFQSTANTWQSGNFIATANQVNVTDSASNDFYLADICLVEDNEGQTRVPDFVYAGRDIFEELQLCQRYYQTGAAEVIGYANAGGFTGYQIVWPTIMRTTPSVTQTNLFASGVSATPQQATITNAGATMYRSVTVAGNNQWSSTWTADAEL